MSLSGGGRLVLFPVAQGLWVSGFLDSVEVFVGLLSGVSLRSVISLRRGVDPGGSRA